MMLYYVVCNMSTVHKGVGPLCCVFPPPPFPSLPPWVLSSFFLLHLCSLPSPIPTPPFCFMLFSFFPLFLFFQFPTLCTVCSLGLISVGIGVYIFSPFIKVHYYYYYHLLSFKIICEIPTYIVFILQRLILVK